VLDKVKKYESYLCSPLTRLGQILDPRIGNGSGMALDMKHTIRDKLTEEYGLSSAEPTDEDSDEKTFDLFAIARRARNDLADALQAEEVDDYFEVTKKSRKTLAKTSFYGEGQSAVLGSQR
jgi:hypothetical protein